MLYIIFALPSPPQMVQALLNRDITNYTPLLNWIEKMSGNSPYGKQLFTSLAGGAILKLNNNNSKFNSPL